MRMMVLIDMPSGASFLLNPDSVRSLHNSRFGTKLETECCVIVCPGKEYSVQGDALTVNDEWMAAKHCVIAALDGEAPLNDHPSLRKKTFAHCKTCASMAACRHQQRCLD